MLAPPLFNVCLDSVIRQLLPQLQQLGVTICYKIDGQLMHCKKPTEEVLMWILMYADDISLACDTAEKLRVAVTTMDATFLRWGLTISTKKTKVLVVGRNAAAQAAESVITLRGDQLEVVSQFKYLGSVFTSDCTLDAEITHRVAAANSAFQHFRRASIWIFSALTLSFESAILSMHRHVSVVVFWRNMGCCEATHQPLGCFSHELLAAHLWRFPA